MVATPCHGTVLYRTTGRFLRLPDLTITLRLAVNGVVRGGGASCLPRAAAGQRCNRLEIEVVAALCLFRVRSGKAAG